MHIGRPPPQLCLRAACATLTPQVVVIAHTVPCDRMKASLLNVSFAPKQVRAPLPGVYLPPERSPHPSAPPTSPLRSADPRVGPGHWRRVPARRDRGEDRPDHLDMAHRRKVRALTTAPRPPRPSCNLSPSSPPATPRASRVLSPRIAPHTSRVAARPFAAASRSTSPRPTCSYTTGKRREHKRTLTGTGSSPRTNTWSEAW